LTAEEVQLSDEEKSSTWEIAQLLYATTIPIVFAVPILFYTTDIQRDIVCRLATFAEQSHQTATQCLITELTYETCAAVTADGFSNCIAAADWRWPVYLCTMAMPLVYILIEFSMNQIEMSARHVTLPMFVSVLYLAMTYVGQIMFEKPIYPSSLDWSFPDETRTTNALTFIGIFLGSVFTSYWALLGLHTWKITFFRRRRRFDFEDPLLKGQEEKDL